jgi:hypothetical protein
MASRAQKRLEGTRKGEDSVDQRSLTTKSGSRFNTFSFDDFQFSEF